METATDNLNRFETPESAARSNHTLATWEGAIPISVPPPRPSCSAATSAAGASSESADEPLVLWADSSVPRNGTPWVPLPWRTALLPGAQTGLLAEKCLYLVLAATAASSLLAALWQLHSLETGWAAFAQLISRMIS